MTHSPTDPDQTTHPATPPRSYYTRGQLRAADLVAGDVILVDARWRWVLDVWTDENRDAALSYFGADTSAVAVIDRYLTGLSQWVVIRYLIEQPEAVELSFKLIGWRRCELVTVQVPDPTLPGPHRLLPADDSDRTLEMPPPGYGW